MRKVEVEVQPELKIIRKQIPHILQAGEVGAVLELQVRDEDGRVTEKRVLKSESFVRQFLEFLWVQMQWLPGVGATSIRSLNDAYEASVWGEFKNLDANAGIGVTGRGILVGTGTTAPAVDDYKMETQIAHGTGAGQLEYSAVTFGAPTSDATTSQFTVTRNFANNSGGDITVNEIGLAVCSYQSGNAEHNQLVVRDVIAGGIAVPNGQTLTVNYRIQAVV